MRFPKHNESGTFLFMLTFTAGGVCLRPKLAGARSAATTPHSGDVSAERMADDAQVERLNSARRLDIVGLWLQLLLTNLIPPACVLHQPVLIYAPIPVI